MTTPTFLFQTGLYPPRMVTSYVSNVDHLSRILSDRVAAVWEENGRRIGESDHFQVRSATSTFVRNLRDSGCDLTFPVFRSLWDHIPYATSQTAYPRIATPAESVLGHLHGLLLLWGLWGDGIADCWREADFASEISYDVDKNFHVTISPGSHETVAGVDYRLLWAGKDMAGEDHEVVLAVVGYIPRRDGFGVTLVQGGPRLTEIKILREGKASNLLKLAQARFAGDPRSWLLAEVVRRLRRQDPARSVYWLRAERRAPLYCHTLDPSQSTYGNRFLFPYVGHSPLSDLPRLVEQAEETAAQRISELHRKRARYGLEGGEEGELEKYVWSLKEAVRIPFLVRRLNEMATSVGFKPEDEESAWWVLPTASEA